MSYKIFPTEDFIKAAKRINAVYPDFKQDLAALGKALKKNPLSVAQLASLGDGLYKCRIDISGKGSGKSFEARIIYLLISADKEVWMMACYDKSTKKDLTEAETRALRLKAKAAQNSLPGSVRSDLLKNIYRKKKKRSE